MEPITTTHATHMIGAPLTAAEVETNANGFLLPDIDKRLLKIRPMSTPIDQISRSARSRSTSSMEVQYFAVDNRPASVPITSLSADNTECTFTLQDRLDARAFALTDTLLLAGELGGDKAHTFYVTKIDGKTITCAYIGPDDNFVPTLQNGEGILVRMGRAAAELDVQTPQTTFIPRSQNNFCQIFKSQVEVGSLLNGAITQADVSFTDQQEAAIIDMRMGMERNFIFGSKRKISGEGGNTYFTQGIWYQAAKEFELPTDVDAITFIEMCRQAFTGNGGASRKVLIGGSACIKSLVNPGPKATLKQVGSVETEIHWGLNLKVISSNFGTLYVIHSETFDLCGHEGDGLIIDPEYLQKYVRIPLSAMKLDLKKSGQRNSDAVVLTEASCLVLRYPEAHMRLVAKRS